MKTFEGWREVGRAMRWARWNGIGGYFATDLPFGRTYAWGRRADGQIFEVSITFGISHSCGGRGPRKFKLENLPATEVLRVLAALDLIPAELAEVAA